MLREISPRPRVLDDRKRRLEGPERKVVSDLMELAKAHDPYLILLPYADTLGFLSMVRKPEDKAWSHCSATLTSSAQMASKSHGSHGKVNHKKATILPEAGLCS